MVLVEPPFSITPREDVGGLFSGCVEFEGGVRTEEHVIENLPFAYAVPVLSGWDLAYPCDDEHVTEVGIWLHDIDYTNGTLRYSVSSILRDKNSVPQHLAKHSVHVLGLNTGNPRPPRSLRRRS